MDKDIEYFNKVINIKNKSNKDYHYFCWIYPFTNENIKGYYSYIDFKDKSVLTPTSSSDHALNAYLLGASNVDSFDINPLAKYYGDLKCACIKTLSLDEFISFLYNKSFVLVPKNYMNKDIYNFIRKELNDNSKYFWDYVFNNYKPSEMCHSHLFTDDFLKLRLLFETNLYFNIDNYNKLSNILKKKSINYYDINIKDLSSLGKKYDIIILSNIPAYLDLVYKNRVDYLKDIKDVLNSIKGTNSYTVINYFYNNLMNVHGGLGIYDTNEVNKNFLDSKYIFFDSIDKLQYPKSLRKIINYEDAVLVSKK